MQVRISGENVILNNVDHSIQVYRLKANGNYELVQDKAGEVAQAWRFEVSADKKNIVTSMLSLREFDIESLQSSNSEVSFQTPRFLHSLALVSLPATLMRKFSHRMAFTLQLATSTAWYSLLI